MDANRKHVPPLSGGLEIRAVKEKLSQSREGAEPVQSGSGILPPA